MVLCFVRALLIFFPFAQVLMHEAQKSLEEVQDQNMVFCSLAFGDFHFIVTPLFFGEFLKESYGKKCKTPGGNRELWIIY